MSEIINDSNDEVLAVEETVETPAETIEEAVVEAPEEAAVAVEVVEAKAEKPKKEKAVAAPTGTSGVVALFSTRNISWDGVGSVKSGYNLLPADEAAKWINGKIRGVREATPEEIAARSAN